MKSKKFNITLLRALRALPLTPDKTFDIFLTYF